MGRTKDTRLVLCLEENVVTGAADGYARMAGQPDIKATPIRRKQ